MDNKLSFDELDALWVFVNKMWQRAKDVYDVTKDHRLLQHRFDCTECEEIITAIQFRK